MDYIFAKSKVFKLYAFLHDAAGPVKSTRHKEPDYHYVSSGFPSSCFLGHMTGLLFCFFS